MDLVGGHVSGHIFADLRAVIGLTVGQRRRRERRAGAGDIFLAQEIEQLGMCGDHRLADRRSTFAAQLGLHRCRDGAREFLERRIVEILLDRRLDHLRHADVAAGECHLGGREPAREPGAHIGDVLVEIARHVAQRLDVRAVLVLADEAVARRSGEIAPEAGVRGKRLLVIAKALFGEQRIDLALVDQIVDPALGAELGRVDRRELARHRRPARQPRGLCRRADIGQTALRGRRVLARALLLRPPLIFAVDDRLEPGIGARRLRRGRRGGGEQDGGEEENGLHDVRLASSARMSA